jgi:DNA-binding NarL/FixJ family response regulator
LEKVSTKSHAAAARACEAAEGPGACAAAFTRPAKPSPLTAAEKKVLALVCLAKTNKEIAVALCISPSTVKRHIENLLRKLELRNRVEAAIYALMVAGCPRGLSPDCPLERWQKERTLADQNWAV